MTDKMMRVAGRFENDDRTISEARGIRVDKDGYLLTRVTGSNVEEVTILPSTALTDSALTSSAVDLSKFKETHWFVTNSTDVSVEFQILFKGAHWRVYNQETSEWVATSSTWHDIPIGIGHAFYLNKFMEHWTNIPLTTVTARIRPKDAVATRGSVSLYVLGVPN